MSTKNEMFVLQREAAKEPFKAEIDGKSFSFAHVADLDQFEFADLLASDPNDRVFVDAVVRMALSDDDLASLRACCVKQSELEALFVAYKAHCGLNVGESLASSD